MSTAPTPMIEQKARVDALLDEAVNRCTAAVDAAGRGTKTQRAAREVVVRETKAAMRGVEDVLAPIPRDALSVQLAAHAAHLCAKALTYRDVDGPLGTEEVYATAVNALATFGAVYGVCVNAEDGESAIG